VKILVALKRVPDPGANIKVKAGGGVSLEGVNFVVNPFCEIAVEEALRLRDKAGGGEVVVATVGPKEAQQQLRTALAMGADRAIWIDGADDALDSDVVAQALVKVFEQEKPDLILLGKQTTDYEANQVGQLVAEYLGIGQATFAYKIEIAADKSTATVQREADGGIETVEVRLPAVVTSDLRLNEPRYPSLPGIMKAKKKPLAETTLAALGVSAVPKVRVTAVSAPPERKSGTKVATVEELVAKLKNEAKVL
jgi:electron transfer flavoprotein beta subunit